MASTTSQMEQLEWVRNNKSLTEWTERVKKYGLKKFVVSYSDYLGNKYSEEEANKIFREIMVKLFLCLR